MHQRLYRCLMKSKKPPKKLMPRSKRLMEIIEKSGGPTELAEKLGITQGAVSQWRDIPLRRVVAVSKIVRMSLHEVRPDVF